MQCSQHAQCAYKIEIEIKMEKLPTRQVTDLINEGIDLTKRANEGYYSYSPESDFFIDIHSI